MKFHLLLFAAAAMLVAACSPKQADDQASSMSRISVSGNHFVNAEGDSIVFRGLCCSDPIKLYNDSMWNERYFDDWDFTLSTQGKFFKPYLMGKNHNK